MSWTKQSYPIAEEVERVVEDVSDVGYIHRFWAEREEKAKKIERETECRRRYRRAYYRYTKDLEERLARAEDGFA